MKHTGGQATGALLATSEHIPLEASTFTSPCATADPILFADGYIHFVTDDDKVYTTLHLTGVGTLSGLKYVSQSIEHVNEATETTGTILVHDLIVRAKESTDALTGVGDDFYLHYKLPYTKVDPDGPGPFPPVIVPGPPSPPDGRCK